MAAKKKAKKRTTQRSRSGNKLYAVRNASGEFEDVQTYKRAQGQDEKRVSKAETAKRKRAGLGSQARPKESRKEEGRKEEGRKEVTRQTLGPLPGASGRTDARCRSNQEAQTRPLSIRTRSPTRMLSCASCVSV